MLLKYVSGGAGYEQGSRFTGLMQGNGVGSPQHVIQAAHLSMPGDEDVVRGGVRGRALSLHPPEQRLTRRQVPAARVHVQQRVVRLCYPPAFVTAILSGCQCSHCLISQPCISMLKQSERGPISS